MTHEPHSAMPDLDAEVRRSSRPPAVEKLAYSVREAAQAVAISRSRLYELIGAGEIRILKDGGRTLIRKTELEAYLHRLELASQPPLRARSRSPNHP
jgi:excisionase family DNA binding protein